MKLKLHEIYEVLGEKYLGHLIIYLIYNNSCKYQSSVNKPQAHKICDVNFKLVVIHELLKAHEQKYGLLLI